MERESDAIPYTAIVVDGATADDAQSLQAEFGIDVPVYPDPNSALTRAAGLRFIPCEYTLNSSGRLIDIETEPVVTIRDRRPAAE